MLRERESVCVCVTERDRVRENEAGRAERRQGGREKETGRGRKREQMVLPCAPPGSRNRTNDLPSVEGFNIQG